MYNNVISSKGNKDPVMKAIFSGQINLQDRISGDVPGLMRVFFGQGYMAGHMQKETHVLLLFCISIIWIDEKDLYGIK